MVPSTPQLSHHVQERFRESAGCQGKILSWDHSSNLQIILRVYRFTKKAQCQWIIMHVVQFSSKNATKVWWYRTNAGQTLQEKQENLRDFPWLELTSLCVFAQYDCNLLLWLCFTGRFPIHTQTKPFKTCMEHFSLATWPSHWEAFNKEKFL